MTSTNTPRPLSLFPFFLPPCPLPLSSSFQAPLSMRPRLIRTPLSRQVVNMATSTTSNPTEKILSALSNLSAQPRLTVPDIATAAALPLSVAQPAIHELALQVAAPVDVTDLGTLVYRFPRDTRQRLQRVSLAASVRAAWARVFPSLFSAVRVAFGVLLIVSIVVTFVAITALSSAARSDDERRSSRPIMPMRLFAPDIFDVIFYSTRPRYYYGSPVESRRTNEGEMSFLEAVYSFVFGDGDPNVGLDDRRWRLVAATIRANRGAVTAEQLAPFLDLPKGHSNASGVVDEAYVLPVLQRFGGYPEVTEEGDIIYVFPDLRVTGRRGGGGGVDVIGRGVVEEEIKLSKASGGQRLMVGLLGLVNVLGVVTLGAKLSALSMATGELGALVSLLSGTVFPLLAGYAGLFVAVPVLRWFRLKRVNAEIKERNRERQVALDRLRIGNRELKRKLRGAEKYGEAMEVVKEEDVVYSSDMELGEQSKRLEEELRDDFDRRLKG